MIPLTLLMASLSLGQTTAEPIRIDAAVLTLLDQREAPAIEAGVLSEMNVKELQRVKAGDVLGTVDVRDAQLGYEFALAARDDAKEKATNNAKVELAKQEVKLAEVEEKRVTDRAARFPDSVSDEEVEKKKLEADKARAELVNAEFEFRTAGYEHAKAEAELKIAQRKLDRHRILSPIDGVVISIQRRQGEWVQPGENVVRVLKLDALKAEAFVDSREVHADVIGRTVKFRLTESTTEYTGVIRYISPEANIADGLTRIWAEIDNSHGKLTPGQRGSIVVLPK